ncbi:uncharacterized protein CIMG_06032 [Coccidioides immitis RS]|uniref:DUF1770 domain-containing protein n=3 Tax=Coccidioides immitis TaxID=5501 RepID=A0A0E1RWI7_COCIM|nr:uncharacterized protein CIMG_06032 [Coccidioides immitis RS]EAS30553.1 hypothetical protein CIMG_06032 [Coccidioides immitis RS]KMP03100.1 hypothetical protein CIRG_02792 [Coccidioides immitis RMSCC 2394]KMU76201.1 hypothetical protein CISG_05569 [Coccidioides immitis RMSCC 3703]
MSDRMRQVAESFQTSSINQHSPSSHHETTSPFSASHRRHHENTLERVPSDAESLSTGIVDPSRMVKSNHHRATLPPLPELRFEQSYLASISGAESWGRIAWITVRDQVLLPLMQGTLWTLALCGWKYWHREAQSSGRTVGFTIRRWWWKLNGWDMSRL